MERPAFLQLVLINYDLILRSQTQTVCSDHMGIRLGHVSSFLYQCGRVLVHTEGPPTQRNPTRKDVSPSTESTLYQTYAFSFHFLIFQISKILFHRKAAFYVYCISCKVCCVIPSLGSVKYLSYLILYISSNLISNTLTAYGSGT